MVGNAFFMNVTKIIKHFTNKSFSVLKNAKNSIFEHTKTFFWQNVLLFLCHIHFFIDETHMLSLKVFVNCKIFKYWIKKHFFQY